jgi:hypothetical protein
MEDMSNKGVIKGAWYHGKKGLISDRYHNNQGENGNSMG